MSKTMRVFSLLAWLVVGWCPTVVLATTEPYGQKVEFESLWGNGETRKVWGYLAMPDNASSVEKRSLPAMVLVHGSGGLGAREADYVAQYRQWGIAVLTIAPFETRGVRETATDQSQVSGREMNSDAAGALRFLQTHEKIDPTKVGIHGSSKGGVVAFDLAFPGSFRWRKMEDAERFALHISVYSGCVTQQLKPRTTGHPILMLHGEADDYVSPVSCKDYADRLQENGAQVQFISYPDAHHGFDGGLSTKVTWGARVQNASKCRADIAADGSVTDLKEGIRYATFAEYEKIFWKQRCVTLGAHAGTHPQAKKQALVDIKKFLVANQFLDR